VLFLYSSDRTVRVERAEQDQIFLDKKRSIFFLFSLDFLYFRWYDIFIIISNGSLKSEYAGRARLYKEKMIMSNAMGFVRLFNQQITRSAPFIWLTRKGAASSELNVNILGIDTHIDKAKEVPVPAENIEQYNKFRDLFSDAQDTLQAIADMLKEKGLDTVSKGIEYTAENLPEIALDNQKAALLDILYAKYGKPTKEELAEINSSKVKAEGPVKNDKSEIGFSL